METMPDYLQPFPRKRVRHDRGVIAKSVIENRQGPCVYLFLKGKEVLYVGASSRGFIRVFNKDHHARDARATADTIRILWFATWSAALEEETRLIKKHRPALNKSQNPEAL